MWQRLGNLVIKYRLALLVLLFISTGLMGYFASKVKLSYEFSKAIPEDNQKYKDYLAFKDKFGDDGNVLVIGIKTDSLFDLPVFKAYAGFQYQLKQVKNVQDVLGVMSAIELVKDSVT